MFPEEFSKKLTEIKSSHNHELANLQRGYSVERREIEDAYKMEIAQLEDQHIQEKNKIIKELRKEQVSFWCFKWCMWLNYVCFKMQLLKKPECKPRTRPRLHYHMNFIQISTKNFIFFLTLDPSSTFMI